MTPPTRQLLAELLSAQRTPCLSLYQPTHRRHPENQQDPIRFRNLVKEMEASLRQRYPSVDVQALLKPFEALGRNEGFWNHTSEGLAVFAGPDLFHAVSLPQATTEWVDVTDSFYTKPLRRFLQSVDRYQVLGLSLQRIRIFEGNRHALEELDLVEGTPRTISDALGEELSEPYRAVGSYGGVGGDSTAMHHGHGGKGADADSDAERFFRIVDRAVLEHYSAPSGLPLILAALPEHHHLFHQVSVNPHLQTEGVQFNRDMTADELSALAWKAIEPAYKQKLVALGGQFTQARSKGLGSDDLAEVGEAAASGRVVTLLLEAERHVAGHFDGVTGRVDLTSPESDDVLDDLGELVAKMGGGVMVLPAERMPSQSGLAATYRY